MDVTPGQETAAAHRAGWMLVAAGAGSGKTTVLAERCARLVADKADPCSIVGLLVLTFTRDAASVMRGRIAAVLREKAARASGAEWWKRRLQREAALVDQAHIGTFDSFCAWLVRTYFAECGVDPGFAVLDELEAELLLADAVRATTRLWLQRQDETGGRFGDLFDFYVGASVDELRRFIDPVLRLLQSMPRSETTTWAAAAANGEASLQQFAVVCQQRLQQLAVDIDTARDNAIFAADAKRTMHANLSEAQGALRKAARILRERGLNGLDDLTAVLPDPGFAQAVRLSERAPDIFAARHFKKNIYSTRKNEYRKLREELTTSSADNLRLGQQWADQTIGVLLDFAWATLAAYDSRKHAANQLDFADLEQRAVAALEENSGSLAERIRRRFRHILVDEYQDINPLQERLVELLSGGVEKPADGTKAINLDPPCKDTPGAQLEAESHQRADPGTSGGKAGRSQSPNQKSETTPQDFSRSLFGVGDIYQSIYAFRGSEPALMQERLEVLRQIDPARVVRMAENFRSLPPLIDAFNAVFTPLFQTDQVSLRAQRCASAPDAATLPSAPVQLHVLVSGEPSEEPPDETESEPASDVDHGESGFSDPQATVPAGDDGSDEDPLAELDANQRQADLIGRMIAAMRRDRRVITGREGMCRPVEFGDIAILLRAPRSRAAPFLRELAQRGVPAMAALRTGLFDCPEVLETLDLLRVLDNPAQDIALASALLGPFGHFSHDDLMRIRLAFPQRTRVPFHQAVRRFAAERRGHATDGPLAAALLAFSERLRRWRDLILTLGVAEGLNRIYEESDILWRVLGTKDGPHRVANLRLLHQRAVEFSAFGAQSLARFMAFLRQLQDTRTDLGEAAPADVHAVRLLSIHAAKGLEFPVVFVAGLGGKFNLRELSGKLLVNRIGVGMKWYDRRSRRFRATVGYQMIRQEQRRRLLDEEARLLYVAMTRARDHLILVGHAKPRDWQAWQAFGQPAAGQSGEGLADGAAGTAEMPVFPDPLAARSALDWLGPIFSWSHPSGENGGRLELIRHDWSPPPTVSDHPPCTAAPASAAGVPERDATLARLLEPIGTPYPFELQTRLSAVTTVSKLKANPAYFDEETPAASLDGRAPPNVLPEAVESGGVTRGMATHTILQRLDLTTALDETDIRRQIDSFVDADILAAADAATVDVAALVWLFTTPLGQRLRAAAEDGPAPRGQGRCLLRRELAFLWAPSAAELEFVAAPAKPATTARSASHGQSALRGVQAAAHEQDRLQEDFTTAAGQNSESLMVSGAEVPADRPLVRGIIDALLIEPAGLHVIDYKTDEPTLIAERLPVYRRQVQYYGRAAAAILQRPVIGGTLVLLSARCCETVR